MRLRTSALLLGGVWLAACTHAPIDDERSGAGASGLGMTGDQMRAGVATHVAPVPSQPSSHAGNDPDSPASAAAVARDAGAATGANGDSGTNMTHGETAAPQAPPSLRSAEPGSAPVFDPGTVYMLGSNAEVGSNDPQEIAPVEVATDSVAAIGWFSSDWIRRSDGHLLYQENNYGDPVREFIRDDVPLLLPDANGVDWHKGEPEIDSGSLPCNPGETSLTTQRRFTLAWDGDLYHTCGAYDVVPAPEDPDTQTWYDAAGNEMYTSKVWLKRAGAQGVAIGTRGGNELVVFQFKGGAELASIDVTNQDVIAARMRADGFWVALRDTQTHDRSWLDIDLSGNVTARGGYAPMPAGVSYVGEGNAWSNGGAAAIDGVGRLYEFAGEPDPAGEGNVVVVRRPRDEGTSDVPYRSHPTPIAEHEIYVMEPLFITGG